MTATAALISTYQEAESLLISGELRQAASLCQKILETDPDFAYGHHLMAALFRTTGNLDKALDFERMALARAPHVPAFHMQLGQICFARSDWNGAAEAFKTAHTLEPGNPFHVMLWADTRVQQGRFEEALDLFRRARAIGDIPDIDEHEGLALLAQGKAAEAEVMFDKVVVARPDYFWGHVHKGKLLMAKGCDQDAEMCFATAIKLNASAHEALHCMALICERRGQTEQAIQYAMKTVQANPTGASSHALLGGVLLTQRQEAAAEQVLRQAHELDPADTYVMELLVAALLAQNKKEEGRSMVEQLLARQPDNSVLRHIQLSLSGGNAATAPREYITKLFDGAAERFDYQLQRVLSYRTPQLLADAVRGLQKSRDAGPMSLLDLGCGTGLAAEALKDLTASRVGVDLSPRMLDKARTRQLYEALHHADVTEFMLGSTRRFDLVAAADVLVYFGDLSPFLAAARNVLSAGSLLAFSVERGSDSEQFRLQESGRYTHSHRYVMKVAAEEGYALVKQQDVTLRMEKQKPVAGTLFIFKKAPTH
jgi:predicted TPR repeat methyltransferase